MSYEKRLDELRLVTGARKAAHDYLSSVETKLIPYVIGWLTHLAPPPTEEQLLLLQDVDDFLMGESRRMKQTVEQRNSTIQKLELSHAQHMDHVRSQLVAAETESASLRAEVAALQETIAKHTHAAQAAAMQSKVKMPELPDVGAMQTAVSHAMEQLGGVGRQLKDPSQ